MTALPPFAVRGPDWPTDVYRPSPGPKDLLTVFGAERSLRGIRGYNDPETTDESPERVALIRQVTVAYLHEALGIGGEEWHRMRTALLEDRQPLGRLESK